MHHLIYPELIHAEVVPHNELWVEEPGEPLPDLQAKRFLLFTNSHFARCEEAPEGFCVFINCHVPVNWYEKYKDSTNKIFFGCRYSQF